MQVIEFIIKNLDILIAIFCLGLVVGVKVCSVIKMPNREKKTLFKSVLLQAVKQAEEEIGNGEGQKKLSFVYDKMVKQFPFMTYFMTEDAFNTMVNGALYEVGIWLKDSKCDTIATDERTKEEDSKNINSKK